MRRAIFAGFAMMALAVSAQTETGTRTIADVINDGEGNVTVVQSAAIDRLLVPKAGAIGEGSVQKAYNGTGFRVEVYSDNNVRNAKATAEQRKRAVEERLGVRGYLTFNSPYWTLRVGDFRTYNDADRMLAEIKAAFPEYATDLRIVRERVTISGPTE